MYSHLSIALSCRKAAHRGDKRVFHLLVAGDEVSDCLIVSALVRQCKSSGLNKCFR